MSKFLQKEDKRMTNNKKAKVGSKFPLTAVLFIVALIAGTVIRYSQYVAVFNHSNGFFDHDGGFLNHVYYVFFAIFAGLFLLLYFVDKRARRGILPGGGKKPVRKNVGFELSIFFAVLGAALFASCGVLLAIDISALLQSDAMIAATIAKAVGALGYVYAGYAFVVYKRLVPSVAIGLLFVAAYNVVEAVIEFMQRIYTLHLSAQLIQLSIGVLLAVFFLASGKIFVKSESRFTAFLAAFAGFAATVLIVTEAVAQVVYYGVERMSLEQFLQWPAVLFLIYALSAKKNDMDFSEGEEVEENVTAHDAIVD